MDMQLDLREFLFLAGVIVIIIIMIDGVRRMRLSRNQIQQGEKEASDGYSHELPRGGARKVDLEDLVLGDEVDMAEMDNEIEQPASIVIHERDLIMESTAYTGSVSAVRAVRAIPKESDIPVDADEWTEEVAAEINDHLDHEQPPAEEIVVITVIAKKGESFSGNSILTAAKQAGLKHGEMNIFHRYEQGGLGKRGYLFSMANVLEPGSFNLQEIHKMRTPGVCFFLNLPGPKKSVLAFELLVDTARKMAKFLGGELQDGRRNAMTTKSLEQLRQKVVDFERRGG